MTRFLAGVAAALAVLFHSPIASAQIQLAPADAPRFDAAVQVGWTSADSGNVNLSDRRYDSGAVAGSAGVFLTRHLKFTFGAAQTGDGSAYQTTVRAQPGTPPVYSFSEHRFHATTFNSAIGYQFFENRWVHPMVAVGVQVAHETDRVETQGPFTDRVPAVSVSTVTGTHVRPFVGAGVKFYMSERAFIQTNLDVIVSASPAQRVTWVTGVGFDF